MTAGEHYHVELKVPKDLRAAGAVRGALEHAAKHAGLPAAEEDSFIASADRLLRSALSSLSSRQEILVRIEEGSNRIEIELVRPGGSTTEWESAKKLPGIDEVEQETAGGQTRLKLVKVHTGAAKRPSSEN